MKVRLMTAAVVIPVFLACFWFGGIPLVIMGLLLTGIGVYEFQRMAVNQELNFSVIVGIIAAVVAMAIITFASGAEEFISGLVMTIFVAMILLLLAGTKWNVMKLINAHFNVNRPLLQHVWRITGLGVFAILYTGIGFGFMLRLRSMHEDIWPVLLVFIVVWTTDTGAYIVGRYLGKHKLMVKISPNKTWEGAIGGVLAALICGNIYGYFMLDINIIYLLPVLFAASMLCQLGDLFESYLKRWAGVKDSGKLLPGHGGILDRFDGMIFVAPFIYFCLTGLV